MRRGRPAAPLLLLLPLLAGTLPGLAAPPASTDGTVAAPERRVWEGPRRAVYGPERAGGEGGRVVSPHGSPQTQGKTLSTPKSDEFIKQQRLEPAYPQCTQ